MKIIRVHTHKKSRAFALPVGIRQKVALLLRGWRPAYLPYVSVPWWSRPYKPLDLTQ
jgi:hypothetical protein